MFFELKKTDKLEAVKNLISEHLDMGKKKQIVDWLSEEVEAYVIENNLCYNCFVKMRYKGYVINRSSKRKSDGALERVPTYLECPKCSERRYLE